MQAIGWDSMAFVLLNRFLDIADIVEDNNGGLTTTLDNSDFELTDIPFEKLLIPNQSSVSDAHREQIKEWVLAVSLDQRVQQVFQSLLSQVTSISQFFYLFFFSLAIADGRARSLRSHSVAW